MSKLKVLHIIWSTNTGGIERLVLQLWQSQLKDEDLEVSLYAGQPEGTLWSEFINTGKTIKGQFRNGSDLSISKINRTRELFKQFDILHFHSFHPATAIAAVLSGKRIIYTEHGNFGFGRPHRLHETITRSLLKYFLRTQCSYITFNSVFSKTTSMHRYGIHAKRTKVIYNGIPDYASTATPDPDILEFTNEHFTIGYVGRLAAVKRIDRLIETAVHLSKKIDFRLLIIGEGSLKYSLEKNVNESGLGSKILFAGARKDVRRYYPHFDAFVLPSSNEAFGLVVAEALYAGTPCYVFSDAGGPVELVSMYEPDNICASPEEMAKKLFHLSMETTKDTGKEGRKATARLFSIEKMEESFKQLYREI